MPAAKKLDGQVFGRLTVLNRSGNLGGRVLWSCQCACGRLHEAVSHALTSGHTKSCGCWKDERNTSTPSIHGHASRAKGISPTYRTWQCMITRCTNVSVKSYKDYGARGISVYAGWLVFENFLADMGEKPSGMSIERMDNEKGYGPDNCKWATKIEQARNTRANKFISYKGKRMTQAEFAEVIGHNQSTVSYRLRSGWTPEQVANTPANPGNRVADKLGDEVDVPEELL
jgi:hypothetical protein